MTYEYIYKASPVFIWNHESRKNRKIERKNVHGRIDAFLFFFPRENGLNPIEIFFR